MEPPLMAATLDMTDLPDELELFVRRVTCTPREQRCLIALAAYQRRFSRPHPAVHDALEP